MGWDEELFTVFDELERRAEEMYAAEREMELADRVRAEYAQVSVASRVLASVERDVAVEVRGVGVVRGRMRRAASTWFLLRGGGHDWVIPTAAVIAFDGLSPRSLPEAAWSPVHALGLGSALRRLADAGEPCVLHLVDGQRHDLALSRIGQDFAEGAVGAVEGGQGISARTLVLPFAVIAAAQSRGVA